jgi:Family of unknown function (DUF5990)
MERELNLRIVLENPAPDVAYGLQKGRGNDYETVQTQRARNKDLLFDFSVRVSEGKNGQPNFLGPFAQGTAADRFVYLDIGTYAGQKDTGWSRRLKIPLVGISWQLVEEATASGKLLEARVAGRGGRDGGPSCGTVKRFSGWQVKK